MSWEQLGEIQEHNVREVIAQRSRSPVDCPNDGTPLESGRTPNTWHCPFGGEVYDSSGRLVLNPK